MLPDTMTGRWKAGSSRLNIQVVCGALSATCSESRRTVLLLSVSLRVRWEADRGLLGDISLRTEEDSPGSCLCPPAWRAKHQWWKISHWEASLSARTGSPGTAGTAMLLRNYAWGIHKLPLVCSAPAFCQMFKKKSGKIRCGRSLQKQVVAPGSAGRWMLLLCGESSFIHRPDTEVSTAPHRSFVFLSSRWEKRTSRQRIQLIGGVVQAGIVKHPNPLNDKAFEEPWGLGTHGDLLGYKFLHGS